ncbi:MAG: efflux RND transporter permease subunit [Acidobacteriota bacterium]
MPGTEPAGTPRTTGLLDRAIRFCLENTLVVVLLAVFILGWGLLVAPFDWELPGLPRDPVPVDAIPDIGENQQIVFTEWHGRSPQDVEDQITYPLTTALLGIPGVKTIRSFSYFGFSSIYVIFEEDVEFYWSRSRVLEKLNSLPAGLLPRDVQPTLGPDATALGQVFWYTLEGRDEQGKTTGGWDLHELRSIQDWQVRYALQSAKGVAEVASVGGFVQEYQVDVDPDAMRAHGVTLPEVLAAVRMSNLDVGAKTIEINRVEYVVRGLGFLEEVADLERTVVKVNDSVPITVDQVAQVSLGPALRRGAIDKGGAEAVGGVVVVRYGSNPLTAIQAVKEKIAEIAPGLPRKVLPDGRVSQVTIVPFYDRTDVINETLGTLNTALTEEMLVTIIVVLVMVLHLRSSLLISSLLPLSVLTCFIGMKLFGVDANIVALSGIAIAIGTMVDMAIVVCENILEHLEQADESASPLEVVHRATSEVGSAVLTAVLTTVVSFLPVFAMEAAEGKLFRPLAFTKTLALLGSILVALTIIPALAQVFIAGRMSSGVLRRGLDLTLVVVGLSVAVRIRWWAGLLLVLCGLYRLFEGRLSEDLRRWLTRGSNYLVALVIAVVLAAHWLPLGPERGSLNTLFVVGLIGSVLVILSLFLRVYERLLRTFLRHKLAFLVVPSLLVLIGLSIWLGAGRVFGFLPETLRNTTAWRFVDESFPGLGKEFMPPLDEGSYLFMPTTMPHASIGEAMEILQLQDMAIRAIPEVEHVVGKIGRVDSSLDPAPISMVETVITYVSEYRTDASGHRLNFAWDAEEGEHRRDGQGELIPDEDGRPFRQWREEIREPDDIWDEIVRVTKLPGVTSAPRLQPIAARIVMLQSGMRAPMGLKVYGPDQATIEAVGLEIERLLKQVPSVMPAAVVADRIVGKPYLEIDIDREAIARHGLHVRAVQDVIEVAVGGRRVTTTVEGRERYGVRVRYLRELRDEIESLERIIVPAPDGSQLPLGQLATIEYRAGPQAIKAEDTFLVGYVIFDRQPGVAEVDVVEECQAFLAAKIESGELVLPNGVSYRFAGAYENQVRSEKKLRVVLPLALFIIFLILYLQFRSVMTSSLVFSGVLVAWAGGFIMLWCYGQWWFLSVELFGINVRELFQVQPLNLSVAVWVGFLALFGIATDDGVILATYLEQSFDQRSPVGPEAIREATVAACLRRIRPCLMTTGTTLLALVPVLTSTGRGADIMVPMAVPSFGGMTVVLISVFVVPVLYCLVQEIRWRLRESLGRDDVSSS